MGLTQSSSVEFTKEYKNKLNNLVDRKDKSEIFTKEYKNKINTLSKKQSNSEKNIDESLNNNLKAFNKLVRELLTIYHILLIIILFNSESINELKDFVGKFKKNFKLQKLEDNEIFTLLNYIIDSSTDYHGDSQAIILMLTINASKRIYAKLYNLISDRLNILGCYKNLNAENVFPILNKINFYEALPKKYKKMMGNDCKELVEILNMKTLIKVIKLVEKQEKLRNAAGNIIKSGTNLLTNKVEKFENNEIEEFKTYTARLLNKAINSSISNNEKFHDYKSNQPIKLDPAMVINTPIVSNSQNPNHEHFNDKKNKNNNSDELEATIKNIEKLVSGCVLGGEKPLILSIILNLNNLVKLYKKSDDRKDFYSLLVKENDFIKDYSKNISISIAKKLDSCRNLNPITREYFVNYNSKTVNNILKAVLFSLVFFVLNNKDTIKIFNKIIKNTFGSSLKKEKIVIFTMILFAILHYLINLSI